VYIAFTLTMPGNNAWDGRWTGEKDLHARVFNVGRRQDTRERYRKLRGSHRYSFGDGWVACVTVREVDAAEARKLRRDSKGFCGYDWMIDSLRLHGKILVDRPEETA
jgi:hypothetical protein